MRPADYAVFMRILFFFFFLAGWVNSLLYRLFADWSESPGFAAH